MENNKNNKEFSSFMIDNKDKSIVSIIENNLSTLDDICNYTSNKLNNINYEYNDEDTHYISETVNLAKEFLQTIDEKYSNDFENKINNGTIVIYDLQDKESKEYKYGNNHSFCETFNNNKKQYTNENGITTTTHYPKERINIPFNYKLLDSFNMIHEYFHTQVKNDSEFSHIFSETIPITMEYAYAKYLEDKGYNIEGIKSLIDLRLNDLKKVSIEFKKDLDVYKDNKYNIDLNVEIDKNKNREIGFNLESKLSYLIGNMYGICFYNDLCKENTNINNLKLLTNTLVNADKIDYLEEYVNDFISNIFNYINSSKEESLDFVVEKMNENKNIRL